MANPVFFKGTDSSYTLVWTITGICGTTRDTVNLFFPTPYFSGCGQTLNYGGVSYPTIQIGAQCWLAKNFNFGNMVNGTVNPSNNGTVEKYCYNNDLNQCTNYGGLYQWAEAVQYQNGASTSTSPNPAFSGNVKGICPSGWHLPSDAEFCSLTTFIDPTVVCTTYSGSGTDAGGKLKSLSAMWTTPNTGATNSSGFSALPSGYRITNGAFSNLGGFTRFWTSSEASSANGINRLLYNTSALVYRDNLQKNYGFSIRCLLD